MKCSFEVDLNLKKNFEKLTIITGVFFHFNFIDYFGGENGIYIDPKKINNFLILCYFFNLITIKLYLKFGVSFIFIVFKYFLIVIN